MDIKEKSPPPTSRQNRFLDNFLTCRRVLNIMVFLGFMVNYMLRVNLNFAMVDMIFKPNDLNDSITSTPFPVSIDSSNQTRIIRSISKAGFAAFEAGEEDEDGDAEDAARNFRKNNFVGTGASASEPSLSFEGFQTSGSVPQFSSSGGFQIFNNDSASSNQPTSQTGETQFSAAASQASGTSDSNSPSPLPSQSSNESKIQQNKVTGLDSSPQTTTDGSPLKNSDQKVGSNQDTHILYPKYPDKNLPEVRNAQLDEQTQPSTTAVPTTGSKKKKKKRYQKPGVRRFTWSEAEQGYLIGSFFWGYICTELPGGRLAEVIGARKVFGYATLGASVVTLLTPMFAKIHYIMVIILRITLGLFLGPTWPSILPLAGKWIPMNERGKFLSNMMGSTLGAGFTLPICGFIIDTFSWEYVFYTTGLLGFIWSVLWFLLVFETPADHPRITPEERWYIESNLGLKPSKNAANNYSIEEKQVAQGLMNHGDESCLSDNEQKSSDECRNYSTFAKNGNVTNSNSDIKESSINKKSSTGSIADSNGDSFKKSNTNVTDKKSTAGAVAVSNNTSTGDQSAAKESGHAAAPWLHIITSIPVWAFVLTHGASVFGYNTITNQLPTFMDNILNYEIKENGILSSFPYIGKYIAAVVGGTIADKLLKSSRFTKNFVRKLLTTIGVLIPGCLMFFQIFVGNDKAFSIFVFTAALTFNGVVVGGYLGNSLDIAPNFSGTVFGLANMFSGLSGAVSALLVGYLTDHNQVYGQWQKVFFIVAITYIAGALIFLIFGSTDVQPWNNLSEQKKKTETDSDADEETGILESSRRRSSLSSALKFYTEDEWDTSSYVSGLDSVSKLRKKRHRKKTRCETETESFDSSSRKKEKHLRFDHTYDREVSSLKPLIIDQHRDSDSDYAETNHERLLETEDVKLRKSRSEKRNDQDYLLSIKKRASYKEAIEKGSQSDYSYDSENKTRSPAVTQHQRKIKNTSESNESLQTTNRMRKNAGRQYTTRTESASESDNEKKKRNRKYKIRKTSEDEDSIVEIANLNEGEFSTKQKRESYSKKLMSSSSKPSTSISTDQSDSDQDQDGSKKKAKKSAKNKEKSYKNQPEPSTSFTLNDSQNPNPNDDDDEAKPERKFHLPLSSQPKATIKHASSSPL